MENENDLLESDVIFWNSPLKWVILIYVTLLFTLFYFGFKWYLKPKPCEEMVLEYKAMNYAIVIQKNKSSHKFFKIIGKEIQSENLVKIIEVNSPFINMGKYIEIGDTLSKKSGDLIFQLLKQKTIIEFTGLKVKCLGNKKIPIVSNSRYEKKIIELN